MSMGLITYMGKKKPLDLDSHLYQTPIKMQNFMGRKEINRPGLILGIWFTILFIHSSDLSFVEEIVF